MYFIVMNYQSEMYKNISKISLGDLYPVVNAFGRVDKVPPCQIRRFFFPVFTSEKTLDITLILQVF